MKSTFDNEFDYISKNVSRIRERIKKAAESVGRDPSEITLLAAVKYASAEEIAYLQQVEKVNTLGENRVQQLLERYDGLVKEDLELHFIGTLQTNKVKYIADKVDMIHSLDSEKLAAEIDKQCKKHGKVMNVLCEINCGRETKKADLCPRMLRNFASHLPNIPI